MREILLSELPRDQLVLGVVLDPKTNVVEKRVTLLRKLKASQREMLMDESGGNELLNLIRRLSEEQSNMALALEYARKSSAFLNALMCVLVQAIGDNESPNLQTVMRISAADRALIVLRYLIERNPKATFQLDCRTETCRAPLKGEFEILKSLKVKLPDPDDLQIANGRFWTFASAPSGGVESLKAPIPTCAELRMANEGARGTTSYGSLRWLLEHTGAEINGRRHTEDELKDMDEDLFLAAAQLYNSDKNDFGVDLIKPIKCARSGTINKYGMDLVLGFFGFWAQAPQADEPKPAP